MNLYKRIILKDNEFFQSLTADQKQKYIYICGHEVYSKWIANQIFNFSTMFSMICFFIIVAAGNLITNIVYKENIITYILFYSTMSIVTIFILIYIYIIYEIMVKKVKDEAVLDKISRKIQNVSLLNGKIISCRDWIYIRKNYKELYNYFRSESCEYKCYDTVYKLADVLEDPNIYIAWICVDAFGKKNGHAVLMKNNYVYDSNFRKTYRKYKYFNAYSAEIFKKFSIKEYLGNNIYKTVYWEQFGEWCKKRNAVRNKK